MNWQPFRRGLRLLPCPGDKAQDMVTGFLNDQEARGRPVGVAIDRSGALPIADDTGGTVWRVTSAQ
jgi:glucose/arabinose dehydrogenase